MCIKFFNDIGVVVCKGVRIYRRTGDEAYQIMKALELNGGLEELEKKLASYLDFLGNELREFMAQSDFGLRVDGLTKNIDLMDPAGDTIFRGTRESLKKILKIKRVEWRGTDAWFELLEKYWAAIEKLKVYRFGEKMSRVIDGEKVVVWVSEGCTGPDFFYTPQYLFKGSTNSIVKIKMTGVRSLDFELAFQKAKILADDAAGFTWHHLDDFDPETGTCTMQLVKTAVHEAFPHEGAVSMWKLFFGVKYQ